MIHDWLDQDQSQFNETIIKPTNVVWQNKNFKKLRPNKSTPPPHGDIIRPLLAGPVRDNVGNVQWWPWTGWGQ